MRSRNASAVERDELEQVRASLAATVASIALTRQDYRPMPRMISGSIAFSCFLLLYVLIANLMDYG